MRPAVGNARSLSASARERKVNNRTIALFSGNFGCYAVPDNVFMGSYGKIQSDQIIRREKNRYRYSDQYCNGVNWIRVIIKRWEGIVDLMGTCV